MNLKDFFRHKKFEEPDFTETKFAKILGITSPYLSRLKHEKDIPSLELAYLIEQETDGRVSVAENIKLRSQRVRKHLRRKIEE
jgi:transcriptional regulator with XRE-family HTH domain